MNYEDRVTKAYIESAIADGAPKIASGTYTGDGKSQQFISLGFTPRAVLVLTKDGLISPGGGYYYGGLAVTDSPVGYNGFNMIRVTDGGFIVCYILTANNGTFCANAENRVFHYVAFG